MAAPVLQFGSGTITVGTAATPTDAFECQITNFTITPTANIGQVPGTYCQGPSSYAQKSNYAVEIAYLTDWGATKSLSKLLWDEDGNEIFFVFTPQDTTIPVASGSCYAIAGNFGGEGDSLWVSTGSMPCPEKPTLTPDAP
jgi:hypothetical protein